MIKKADIILIAALFLFSAVSMVFFIPLNEAGGKVVVNIDNNIVGEFSLYTDRTETFRTERGYNTLTIKGGKVSVTEADCPDGLCKHAGENSQKGEQIVCLPHRFSAEVR